MLIKVKGADGQGNWIDVFNVGSLRPASDGKGRSIINGTVIIFKNGEPAIGSDESRDEIADRVNAARLETLKLQKGTPNG